MDVLVEMSPGTGWLAREGDRIVFLPSAESVDTAHDVIEPLLIPRAVEESFETLQGWIDQGLPLPPMMLISIEASVRILNHRITNLSTAKSPTHDPETMYSPEGEVVDLGEIVNLVAHDDEGEASGMLIEGVVRAGGMRLYFHREWGADSSRSSQSAGPLEIELGDRRVGVGNGLALGRWPYSDPDFDDTFEPVILNDPAVSRLHASITPTADGAVLADRASHNGTWVIQDSGTSIRVTDEPQPLSSGDQIRIGDTIINVI